MKKQILLFFLIIIMLITSLGWFFVIYAGNNNESSSSMDIFFNPKMRRFVQVLKILQESYYRDVSEDELIEAAINGMLKSLDPHSVYIYKKQDLENFNMATTGEFGGIGFRVGKKDGYIPVIAPIENTPASRAGIKAGDIVIKIDTISTEDMDLDKAVSLMRGKPGTKVKLTINRFGHIIEFDITREIINIKSIPYYSMINDSIGYIKLTQFTENVHKDFKKALDDLFNNHNAKKLILDLRNNPGGLLSEAIDIADFFIPKGLTIVSTNSKNQSMVMEFKAKTPVYNSFFPLIVLVDNGSASASEIVSGAIQDWERGAIVGDTTYGKGSVQSVFDFSKYMSDEDGILKFTTARYFTPSGRSIDRELIKYEKSEKDTHKYYTLGEMHREIYGGGGIIPDYVYEERFLKPVEINILKKQLTFAFVAKYLSEHTITDETIIEFPDKIFEDYLSYLKENDIEINDIINDSTVYNDSKTLLQYEFARQQEGNKLYYQIFIHKDKMIKKSIEFFSGANNLENILKNIEKDKE